MADRSQVITIQNKTDLRLTLTSSDRGGKWTDGNPVSATPITDVDGVQVDPNTGIPVPVGWSAGGPPQNIQAGTTVSFGSESAGEFLGGTGGHISYAIQNSTDFIHFYWDVPFFGPPKMDGAAWAMDPSVWWGKIMNHQFAPNIPGSTTFRFDLTGLTASEVEGDFADVDIPPTPLLPIYAPRGYVTKHPWGTFTFTQTDASRAHRRSYSLVWRPGLVAEIQYYGLKYTDYQQCYDQLFRENWRIYSLSTYVENDQCLYDAVWRPGTDAEIQYYGLKYADYQQRYDQLFKENWRIYLLNTYIVNGQPLYDAVWRPGTSGEMQYYGLNPADLQQRYDELFKENWRIYLLNTYVVNGQRLYDAVWRPGTNAEMHCFGLDVSGILPITESMWRQNWRLEILKTYESSGTGNILLYTPVGNSPTKIR
jgi:hypothetical protein